MHMLYLYCAAKFCKVLSPKSLVCCLILFSLYYIQWQLHPPLDSDSRAWSLSIAIHSLASSLNSGFTRSSKLSVSLPAPPLELPCFSSSLLRSSWLTASIYTSAQALSTASFSMEPAVSEYMRVLLALPSDFNLSETMIYCMFEKSQRITMNIQYTCIWPHSLKNTQDKHNYWVRYSLFTLLELEQCQLIHALWQICSHDDQESL